MASLWVGDRLRWLDKLALASFVHRGHAVTLFHTAPTAPAVPDGVVTRPAADVFDPEGMPGFAPAQTADLFRLHLMRDSDLVWVDTDALCLRPLTLPPQLTLKVIVLMAAHRMRQVRKEMKRGKNCSP